MFVSELGASQPVPEQVLRQGGQPQAERQCQEGLSLGLEPGQGRQDGGRDLEVGQEGSPSSPQEYGLSRYNLWLLLVFVLVFLITC